MEQITYFFNVGYEQNLFFGNEQSFISNKASQEFEYFMHLLNPTVKIFSNKNYHPEYLEWIKSFTGSELKITQDRKNVKFWCGDFNQRETLKKIQDKIELSSYLQEKNLIHHNANIIENVSELKEGKLYKYGKSVSGGGHCIYPRDEKRLLKLLKKGERLVEEDILNRVLDFSALMENQKLMTIYENDVDERFQYKGTLIGENPLERHLYDEYLGFIENLKEFLGDYNGICSVDSFLYKEADKILLYPASEVNARKTMGYIAYKLKHKYFSSEKLIKLKLIKNLGFTLNRDKLNKFFDNKVLLISPQDNLFLTFILLGDSKEEILSLENELTTGFLESI